jgi:hypothetical protein
MDFQLAALCWVLKGASREMVMPFTGIPRDRSFNTAFNNGDDDDNSVALKNLVVLCYCPDSIVKQCLLGLSASTLKGDADLPSTSAVHSGDKRDCAYIRVSREVWDRVHKFMDRLMGRALTGLPPPPQRGQWQQGRLAHNDDAIEDSNCRNNAVQCPLVG